MVGLTFEHTLRASDKAEYFLRIESTCKFDLMTFAYKVTVSDAVGSITNVQRSIQPLGKSNSC